MLKNHNILNLNQPIVYIAHGLNQKNSVWDFWLKDLKPKVDFVHILQLKGHGADESLNNFSYRLWCEQIDKDLKRIFSQAQQKQNPVHIIAYSLGALLVVDRLIENQFYPNKLILIAPAFKPHIALTLIPNVSSKILKSIMIPSLSPKHCRVHNSISLYTYQQIAQAARALETKLNKLRSDKILVFMDPKDELLNAKQTKKLFESQSINNKWSWVNSCGHGLGRHHLLPAKGYLSEDFFTEIITEITEVSD